MDALFLWFWHLINFLMPAVGLATAMWLVLRCRVGGVARHQPRRVWTTLFLLNLAVSVLGVALTGLDGAMATYGTMVLVSGIVSAWFAKT